MDVTETRKPSGKRNTVLETRYVKGVPFVNRRYIPKGYLFCKNGIRKGKGLEAGALPTRIKLP